MNTQSLTPSIFNFQQHAVRSMLIEQQPWFVAKDVCGVLGIKNHKDTLSKVLDPDEVGKVPLSIAYNKGVDKADPVVQVQLTSVINESGMYTLIFKSRKPEAKAFRKWVTKEVLPALFTKGTYTRPGAAAPKPQPAPKALPTGLPAGVLDARGIPTTTVGLLGGKVRMVSVEGKQWYNVSDVCMAIGITSRHGKAATGNMPDANRCLVHLYGAPVPHWFVDETGVRLMLGGQNLLHSQLTLNLAH